MRKATLETILDKACFFGLRETRILPDLQNGKKGLVIEINNERLFARNAFSDVSEIPKLDGKEGWQIIQGTPGFEYPAEKEKWVNCYANISMLRRNFARVAVILDNYTPLLDNIEKSCVEVFCEKDLQKNGIDDLLRLKIAKINIPKTPLFFAAKYSGLFVLLLCALPFLITSSPKEQVSNLRNISGEVLKYSEKGDIVHVFKSEETLTQIARFAIGKYNSLISTPAMISEYLKDNGLSLQSKIKAGDTLRLKLPAFDNPRHKSMQGAWSFFTGLLNDSLAYITEFYNPTQTSTVRRHTGIDVSGRKGARILAPFSGTAWTSEDELGGLMIAIAREKDLIIFMHCDQRFYLDGQTVMEGDPIASVGTSGRTTGPHVHIVTGKITPSGDKNFGNAKYRVLNPFEWYKEI
ncbi:MAG: M23 family metallopeptidase [Fibromonadales bacterium]|nr:M23 family metallopeptidase [Fibromonadales bacterium]